ncbi:MAG: DNA repair protein RadC [Thermodesulfobacteriota bacterium]|nr:DNA repair protein RadC [Thermodesulfobacteriota bacterium]
MTEAKKNLEGHRKRLREKFMKSGLEGFHNYEIVELLLTLGGSRRDRKQQAKEAIRRFKTLRGVLEAPPAELQKIRGVGPHSAFGIGLVQEVAREYLKERMLERPVCCSSKEVFDYLSHSMRGLKKEAFKVMFLDAQNRVIEVEDLFEGTLAASVIYPREVIRSAIKHNAVSLIFAHNHPSGNPQSSDSEKDITRDLVFAGSIMQIEVLDHIIVGDNRYFSFADEGLIKEYQLDFLSLKKEITFERESDS